MKTGESRRGRADREICAVAFFPAVIQTQIAYRATPPGRTNVLRLSDWMERHRWPAGGGFVGVGVGVGVGVPEWVGVGVGVGLGDVWVGVGDAVWLGVGRGDGVGGWLGVGEWLGVGRGLGVTVGLDVAVPAGDTRGADGTGAGVDAAGLGVPAAGSGEEAVVPAAASASAEPAALAAGFARADRVRAVSRACTGEEAAAGRVAVVRPEHGFRAATVG